MSEIASTKLNNSKHFKEYCDRWKLRKTIDDFSDYVYQETIHEVWPAYSFTHSVIDDYNLGDSSIMFCLGSDRVKDYLLQKVEESFDVKRVIRGVNLTIEFLEWLLTVPESERDEVGY
jgi:hypothetical protein